MPSRTTLLSSVPTMESSYNWLTRRSPPPRCINAAIVVCVGILTILLVVLCIELSEKPVLSHVRNVSEGPQITFEGSTPPDPSEGVARVKLPLITDDSDDEEDITTQKSYVKVPTHSNTGFPTISTCPNLVEYQDFYNECASFGPVKAEVLTDREFCTKLQFSRQCIHTLQEVMNKCTPKIKYPALTHLSYEILDKCESVGIMPW